MGFIRKSLVVILSVVLFFLIVYSNMLLIFGLSLNYNTIAPEISSVVLGISDINESISSAETLHSQNAEDYCLAHDYFNYNQSVISQVTIPCSVIISGLSATYDFLVSNLSLMDDVSKLELSIKVTTNHDNMVDYCLPHESILLPNNNLVENVSCAEFGKNKSFSEIILDSSVKEIYYQKYDCAFWNCFEETGAPFFLVSKQAQDYWFAKLIVAILAILVTLIILFFLFEDKANFLIVAGAILVGSSLIIFKLGEIILFLMGFLLGSAFKTISLAFDTNSLLEIVKVFLKSAPLVFLYSFLIGLFVLVLGIVFRSKEFILNIKEKLFSKGENVEVKKEISEKPVVEFTKIKKIRKN